MATYYAVTSLLHFSKRYTHDCSATFAYSTRRYRGGVARALLDVQHAPAVPADGPGCGRYGPPGPDHRPPPQGAPWRIPVPHRRRFPEPVCDPPGSLQDLPDQSGRRGAGDGFPDG